MTLFFGVSSYYQDFYALMGEKSSIIQLGQIANYISSNFVDIVTICQTVEGDQFIVKTIDIPYSINNNLYNCSLTLVPSQNENLRIVVSIDENNLYSIVELPWSFSSSIKIYTNETVPYSGYILSNKICSNKVASIKAVSNQTASFIVFCIKEDGFYTIGLGVLMRS